MLISLLFWAVVVGIIILPFYFIKLVVIQEATAVAFKYLGRFAYCAMEFRGHHFGPDGFICDGDGERSHGRCWCIWRFGGWVFYINPLVKPAKYTDYNCEGDGFGGEFFVRLGDVASNPRTVAAETTESDRAGSRKKNKSKSPGAIPLNVKFTSKMRVVNPYLFLFVSPKDVVREAIEDRQDGVLRAWVNSGNRAHVMSARANGATLWTELQTLNLVEAFNEARNDWGLEIVPNSIIVKDVGFDPDYQEAMEAESKATLRAKAGVAETTGRVMLAIATGLGLSVEELNEKLKTDPGFSKTAEYQRELAFAQDMVKREHAAAAGGLSDFRMGSSDGSALPGNLSYLSVGGGGGAGVLIGGRGNRRGSEKRARPTGGSFKDTRTDAEVQAEWERLGAEAEEDEDDTPEGGEKK